MEVKSHNPKRDLASTSREVYDIYRPLLEPPGVSREVHSGNQFFHSGEKWGRLGMPKDNIIPDGHVRKSLFTEEQEKYNDRCRVLLKEAITSKEDGLLKRFTQKWNSSGKLKSAFENILCESYMECLNEAFDKDPVLLPAFFGFLVASFNGVEGLEIALDRAVYSKNFQNMNLGENYEHFVDVHQDRDKDKKLESHEVQCSAPLLAMKIIEEGRACVDYAGFQKGDKTLKNFDSDMVGFADRVRWNLRLRMAKAGYKVFT